MLFTQKLKHINITILLGHKESSNMATKAQYSLVKHVILSISQ